MPAHCYGVDLKILLKQTMDYSPATMKKLFILLFSMVELGTITAQKKEFDFGAIKSWSNLGPYEISSNGKYVWYQSSGKVGEVLTIFSVDAKARMHYHGYNRPRFTADSKHLACFDSKGLHLIELISGKDEFIEGATDYKIPASGNGRWISYGKEGKLFLFDLEMKKEKDLGSASQSLFNAQGSILLLQKGGGVTGLDLKKQSFFQIYNGEGASSLTINENGDQIIFNTTINDLSTIWYFGEKRKLEPIVTDSSRGIKKGYKIAHEGLKFSEDGKSIFFKVKSTNGKKEKDSLLLTDQVDVWSYKDRYLKSQQLNDPGYNERRTYTAVINIYSKTIVHLEDEQQSVVTVGNRVAITKTITNQDEAYWNPEEITEYKLISLSGFKLDSFHLKSKGIISVELSPGEKFVSWQDTTVKHHFCYDISTGKTVNLSDGFLTKEPIISNDTDKIAIPYRISSWLNNDAAIIVNDHYDIWQIDPRKHIVPICLTGHYGRQHKIRFRSLVKYPERLPIQIKDSILAVVIADSTRFNGFCKLKTSKENLPSITLLGPYFYYFPITVESATKPPLKAVNGDAFVLQRQSDTCPINIFVTSDFNSLVPVSDIQISTNYRCYTVSREQWRSANGALQSGLLYTPEDLDSTKKHPIIFNYYAERSDQRFIYLKPGLSDVNLNIPWYASRGYLVFIPDIWAKQGMNGPSALETIVSGAQYLTTKYRWIDGNRMGLQGHSHGGFITNYVVTHSKLFAAAQSSAGYTDMISGYGQLGFGNASLQYMQEVGQNNLGTTPWEDLATYTRNSSIFSVNDVTTPLLLMHNKDDDVVSFAQSLELFLALRRMKRKAWLLQYDNSGHTLIGDSKGEDFTIRQQQFFDYYLKSNAPPLWMTQGISVEYKGLKSGFETDNSEREP